MRATRDDAFIKQFLSAYETGSWETATLVKPDAIDRKNPAVDQLAERESDGKKLAIEHTIIEPFEKEKEDFASFSKADFASIEKDQSLSVPGLWIEVFVPVGTLHHQPLNARRAIVGSVHDWLRANRLSLREGMAQHRCRVSGNTSPSEITLTVRVVRLSRHSNTGPSIVHVRRQQVDTNLGCVVEKALKKKLPKLVNTPADKR